MNKNNNSKTFKLTNINTMSEKKFTLDNQISLNVDACVYKNCPYFPCHELASDNFSCMFCYCPYYDTLKGEGGCTSSFGEGKWYCYTKDGKDAKVWDCSPCTYPHIKKNAHTIFKSIYKL
jgi:Zn-finger protein